MIGLIERVLQPLAVVVPNVAGASMRYTAWPEVTRSAPFGVVARPWGLR